MKQRIEDLGRIRVMLEDLLDREIMELWGHSAKYFDDWFVEQTEEKKGDIIHDLAYGIRGIHDKLYDILSIAKGDDYDSSSD